MVMMFCVDGKQIKGETSVLNVLVMCWEVLGSAVRGCVGLMSVSF